MPPKQQGKGKKPRAPRQRRAPQKALQPVKAALAPKYVNSPNPYLMKSFVLPSETRPVRLTMMEDIPTNTFNYDRTFPEVTVDTINNTLNPPVTLYGTSIPGTLVICSKQPSRILGLPKQVPRLLTTEYGYYAVGQMSTPFNNVSLSATLGKHVWAGPAVAGGSKEHDIVIGPLDLTPDALSTDPDTLLITSHVATGAGGGYIWLDAGATVNVSMMIEAAATVDQGETATGFLANWSLTFKLVPWNDSANTVENGTNEVFTYSGLASADWHTPTNVIPITFQVTANSGYYRLELTTLSIQFVLSDDNVTLAVTFTGSKATLNITRPATSIVWYQTPEFSMHPQIYGGTRSTAQAFLFSNRSAILDQGGSITACTYSDEGALQQTFAKPASGNQSHFFQRATDPSRGATLPLAKGMYHWIKPSLADANFSRYVNSVGSPLYNLEEKTCVTVISFVSPATDKLNTLQVFSYTHLEAAIELSQSYGLSRYPRLTTHDYELALRVIQDWKCFHENPSHVLEYLKKLGGASWKAFKFVSPALIAAGQAALGGASPAATAMAVLHSLIA